ncbi:MAG: 3-mercaptopyruvate sulfurtransferase [Phyllobacteriaceae bacterium]|nr:3-mercaptopyruvate sulfurtransferase [Phyllobacteriaceae bacterium]
MTDRSRLLVSTEDLAAHLGAPGLTIVDASWYMPAENRSGRAEWAAERIPGAVHFDIDALADRSTDLPHMLLSAEAFAEAVGALGIADDAEIVVYDGAGLFSAPRVWWNLTVYGATNVRILDGGLPKWKAEGRPLDTSAPTAPTPATFTPTVDATRIADLAAVAAVLSDGSAAVVDARGPARFRGEVAEPRPGLRAGHMPGALNVPFATVVADGRLADPATVTAAFAAVDLEKPIVTSCGSGVSAAILWLALESLGVPRDRLALYDGSWTEWGGAPGTAVVTGP